MDRRKSQRVGILGDGQLARMLAEAAQTKLNISATVLGSSKNPAGLVAHHVIEGSFREAASLEAIFSQTDMVSIESEFVDVGILRQALNPGLLHNKLRPKTKAIELLQNKFSQKKFLQHLGISTSDSEAAPQDSSAWPSWFLTLSARWSGGFVLKTAEFGYDGKGVLIAPKSLEDFTAFLRQADQAGVQVYAEEKISFSKELAMTSVRKLVQSGERFEHFPLVVTEQEQGTCFFVMGPAEKLGVGLTDEAREICHKIALEADIEGVFAVEFFFAQGKLLVNEIAPRVHNSSHYTMTACNVSQFDWHWQALLADAEISRPVSASFFGMLNLLAPRLKYSTLKAENPKKFFQDIPDAEFYWYEKSTFSPGRKMGHVNVTARTHDDLSEKIGLLKQRNNQWHQEIAGLL